MKIIRHRVKRMTLREFADKHGLVLEIGERDQPQTRFGPDRYWADFSGAEVKIGPGLYGRYGDGNTEKEAIKDYAKSISGQLLVFNAYDKDKRREIQVPELKEQGK